MKSNKFTDTEFTQMMQLLAKYTENEMDQWELWKLDTPRSKIYINISLYPFQEGKEEAYDDFTYLINNSKK